MEDATTKLELILGADGLGHLQAATVVVLGLGGVGSNCAEALARGGVGRLVILDHDVVQPSNLNRQAIAFRSTLGRKKTEVMQAMIADINPQAQVEVFDRFLLAQEVGELLPVFCAADYVVDAIDTVSTKLALAKLADEEGFRLISSMGAANKLHPECFKAADLYETVNCPLCRIMRKEGRKCGIRHLRVLYSCEQPVEVPSREGAPRRERSNLGTASYVPPIMGQMIAGEVIRDIVGVGGPQVGSMLSGGGPAHADSAAAGGAASGASDTMGAFAAADSELAGAGGRAADAPAFEGVGQ